MLETGKSGAPKSLAAALPDPRGGLSERRLRAGELYGYGAGGALSDANLHQATLSGADLNEANLSGANLKGAVLDEAILSDVEGVSEEELEQQTKSLKGTTMPDGSKHP